MKERIVKLIRRIFGVSEAAVAAEKKAERVVEKRRGKKTRRALVTASALLAAALALPGCNALAGLLRTDTGAAAPVNQATGGGGIAALPGSTVVIMYGAQDARGDVGAAGTSRVQGEATQSTAVDPAAVADAAGKLLATVPAGSPAAALAAAAAATAKKDPAAAAQLLDAAKAQAAPKPAAAPPVAPAPVPTAPTAPESPAAPDAPTAPAEGTAEPVVR